METTVPLHLSQRLARAKSLLKRDAAIRGVEALLSGIEGYDPKNLLRKARFEVEVIIQECVAELNRQPDVRGIFEKLTKSSNLFIPYVPGREDQLIAMLHLVRKALAKDMENAQKAAEEKQMQRKSALEQRGLGCLKAGELSRGKASLRVLAEEFGNDPGVLAQVGEWLLEYGLFAEAAETLEQALEQFPEERKPYVLAVEAYKQMHDMEMAESVYLRAIKQFGRHPRTLLNLAKVYQKWNKREEAFHLAQEAWDKDKSLVEAKEIIDKTF